MIGKKIQKFVTKEIEAFCESYKTQKAEKGEEVNSGQIELIEQLISHFSMDSKKSKKELSEEERCIAITSKKTQCTSKRVENDLCKLHFTKGTKYGVIGDNQDSNDPIDTEEDLMTNTCQYMYKKGKLASQLCNKKTQDGEIFCKKHTPTKTTEYIEEDQYEGNDEDDYENGGFLREEDDLENNSDDD